MLNLKSGIIQNFINSDSLETERIHIKCAERYLEKTQSELNNWMYTHPTK